MGITFAIHLLCFVSHRYSSLRRLIVQAFNLSNTAMADEIASTKGFSMAARPSPEEANRIAAVAGRPILAIDGRYYSGEEAKVVELGRGHNNLDLSVNDANGVVDAINAIADCPSDAASWLSEVDPQGLGHLRAGSVDLAIDWLTELKQKLRPPAG